MSTTFQAPISEDSIIAAKYWVTETPEKTVSHFSRERTPKSPTSSQIDRASFREPLVLRESVDDRFFGNFDEEENYNESIQVIEHTSYQKYWKNTFINEGITNSQSAEESEGQEESASEEFDEEEEEGENDHHSQEEEEEDEEGFDQEEGSEEDEGDDEESSDEEASDQSSENEEDDKAKKDQLKNIKKRQEQAKVQSSEDSEGSDISDFDEDSEDENSEEESSESMESSHEELCKREKRVPTASNSVKNKKKKL